MAGLVASVRLSRKTAAAVLCLLAPALLAGCSRDRTDTTRAPAPAGSTAAADSVAPAAVGPGSGNPDAGEGSAGRPPDGAALSPPAPALPQSSPDSFPADSLDRLSNQLIRWGVPSTRNAAVPRVPASWASLLDRYRGIWLGDTAVKEVFLTLDAGYEAGYTSGLLDTLKAEGVRAIFFVTGHYLRTQPELVRRMVAEGHAVGNHTGSHASMPALDAAGMRAEIAEVQAGFEALTGAGMAYFRPPSGELSERVLAVARGLGYATVVWSLAYKDWEPVSGGPEGSHRTVVERLHNGAVILLHVTSEDNYAAFGRIIRSIKEQGYAFGTPDRLGSLAAAAP